MTTDRYQSSKFMIEKFKKKVSGDLLVSETDKDGSISQMLSPKSTPSGTGLME